jgi:hypothetical protein
MSPTAEKTVAKRFAEDVGAQVRWLPGFVESPSRTNTGGWQVHIGDVRGVGCWVWKDRYARTKPTLSYWLHSASRLPLDAVVNAAGYGRARVEFDDDSYQREGGHYCLKSGLALQAFLGLCREDYKGSGSWYGRYMVACPPMGTPKWRKAVGEAVAFFEQLLPLVQEDILSADSGGRGFTEAQHLVTRKESSSRHRVELMRAYAFRCQVCNERLLLPSGQCYLEAHHICPRAHRESEDARENVLVLCPNHHLEFDRKAIAIKPGTRTLVHIELFDKHNGRKLTLVHRLSAKAVRQHWKEFMKCKRR